MIYEYKCKNCNLIFGTDTDRFTDCSQCGAQIELKASFGHLYDKKSLDVCLYKQLKKNFQSKGPAKSTKLNQDPKANIRNAMANEIKPNKLESPPYAVPAKKIIKGISGDKVFFEN
jgi:DNA-directed RNA polymerase subunit RPC12/RpoP